MSMSQSHCPVPGALQASSGTEGRQEGARSRPPPPAERSSAHTASKPQRPGLAQRVEHRVLRGIAICVSPGPGALRAVWRHGVAARDPSRAWACARRRTPVISVIARVGATANANAAPAVARA